MMMRQFFKMIKQKYAMHVRLVPRTLNNLKESCHGLDYTVFRSTYTIMIINT